MGVSSPFRCAACGRIGVMKAGMVCSGCHGTPRQRFDWAVFENVVWPSIAARPVRIGLIGSDLPGSPLGWFLLRLKDRVADELYRTIDLREKNPKDWPVGSLHVIWGSGWEPIADELRDLSKTLAVRGVGIIRIGEGHDEVPGLSWTVYLSRGEVGVWAPDPPMGSGVVVSETFVKRGDEDPARGRIRNIAGVL